eukprot:COSAG05_NODE_2108_length_3550_cov_2.253839_2_plen_305_part_00
MLMFYLSTKSLYVFYLHVRLLDGMSPNMTTWGGGAIYDAATKKYHSFISTMTNGCSLNHWGSNSRIDHGVADAVTGPYAFADVAIPTWAHNAAPVTLADGSYAIFHIGDGTGATHGGTNCTCMWQGKGWPKPDPKTCPPPPPPPPPVPCPASEQISGYHCVQSRCAADSPCDGTHCDCGPDISEPKLSGGSRLALALAAAAKCNSTNSCAQFAQHGAATKLFTNSSKLVENADWTAYVKVGYEAAAALKSAQKERPMQGDSVHSVTDSGSSIHVSKTLDGPWLALSPNTLGGCKSISLSLSLSL